MIFNRLPSGLNKPPLGSQPDRTHPLFWGLVGWWLMNEGGGVKAYDLSDRVNHGTLTNGPTWKPGKFGTAIDFDGTDDYILLKNSQILFNQAESTISLWVKIDTNTKYCHFYSEDVTGGTVFTFRSSDTGKLEFLINNGVGAPTATSSATLSTGVWYHVAATKSGNSMKTYINGVNDGSATFAGYHSSPVTSVSLGRITNPGPYFHDGLIDNLSLYNRALSAEEIRTLYTNPFALIPIKRFFYIPAGITPEIITVPRSKTTKPLLGSQLDFSHPLSRGLVGHWAMNEGGGNKVNDLSVNRNDGTLTNGATWVGGRCGPAVNFNGTNHFINLDGARGLISLDGSAAKWTTSFWFKTTQAGGDINTGTPTGPVMWERRRAGANTDRQFLFGIHTADVLGFSVTTEGGGITFLSSPGAVNDGVWHHAAAIRDGISSLKLYVDGVEVSTSSSAVNPASGLHLTMGCRTTDAGVRQQFFAGQLDDFRIWDRVLSAEEIRTLYTQPFDNFRRQKLFISSSDAAPPIAGDWAPQLTMLGVG